MGDDCHAGGLEKTISASTASFLAALSTASSLRLAVCAPRQDRRVTPIVPPELISRHPGLGTNRAERMKACPPEPNGTGCRGSNQFRSRPREAAQSEIRSSPVYAGHTIKPLNGFSYFYENSCAGACSLGQDRVFRHAG